MAAVFLRREFDLPESDVEYLDTQHPGWETIREGGTLWLLVHGFPIPDGYNVLAARVAVCITPGYPVVALDMVYFQPALALTSGRSIGGLVEMTLMGEPFQRWSRHYSGENPWRSEVDCLHTHLSRAEEWLRREVCL